MSRERLPNRRPSVTETISFGPHEFHLTVGFSRDGRPLEIFCRCRKSGSELDALIDDAAVIASRLLQHGDPLEAIARGLGWDHGAPASIVAKLIDEARRIAADEA